MKPSPTPRLPCPPSTFGIRLPMQMRTAIFDEAAHQTRTAGRHVSAGAIIREAITNHFARLTRARAATVSA